jgi:hypothetical protein
MPGHLVRGLEFRFTLLNGDFIRKVENRAVRVGLFQFRASICMLALRAATYFFGVYPCHTYSNAKGRVCAFTPPSQWPAFFAKINW